MHFARQPAHSAVTAVRRLCDEHHRLALALVLIAALAARAATLASFSKTIYGAQLMPDEQIYDQYARAFLDGTELPAIVGFNAEVPAYVFSLAYAVFGADPSSSRNLNVLLGTATCSALYFAGAALANRSVGLIAAALGALYGPFVLASVTAEKTALALFLISVCAALGLRIVRRPRYVEIVLFALSAALSMQVRGNALLLVLAAPVAWCLTWLQRREYAAAGRRILAYSAALALVLVPLSSGGMLGATEHGFNLYLGNTLDNPTPYYRPARFAPSQPSLQGSGFVLKASLDLGRTVSVAEAREYYDAELFEQWREKPSAALSKALGKLTGSLHAYEHAHNHNLAFISRFVSPLAWPWLGFGLLLPLAALGTILQRRVAEHRWLAFMACAYWATLVVFFSEVRLRAPLALLLVPLAASGLHAAVALRGRAAARAGLILVVGYAAAHVPTPGAGDLTTAHNLHALLLFDSGDYTGAEKYYRMSYALDGIDSQSAVLGLSAVAGRRGDLQAAEDWLMKLPDEHYKAAEKYVQLGNVRVSQGRMGEAARALERAVDIDPGLLPVYPILEILYSRLSSSADAEHARSRYEYAKSFFE